MTSDKQYPNGATRQRVSRYTVSYLPDGYTHESYLWDVTVVYRGNDRWAVQHGESQSLGRDGLFDWDPYEKSEAWLRNHRFSEQEALELAHQAAMTVKINGRTAEEYTVWCQEHNVATSSDS